MDRFLALLTRDDKRGLWLDMWQLFVRHPWYQAELSLSSRRALRRAQLGPELLDDLKHEVMLILARKLRATPTMHVEPRQLEAHFTGWLGTIVLHDCREAIRRMKRRQPQTNYLESGSVFAVREIDIERQIDLSCAISHLGEPECTALILHFKGWTTKSIASELVCSYWQVRRILNRGLEKLKAEIGRESQ